MSGWAVIIPADRWATERLFHNESVTVAGAAGRVAPDDEVLLVADGNVVALCQAVKTDGDDLVLAYLRRAFDEPVAAADLVPASDVAAADLVPASDVAGGVAPASDVAGGVAPASDVAGGVAPAFDVAGGVAPASDVAAGMTPVSEAGPFEVEPELFRRLASALSGRGAGRAGSLPAWLVSVALPIEARTSAAAVRQFWSHVLELGPAELPTYVWPSGDELAMQAFVLGEEANQDPEEDETD